MCLADTQRDEEKAYRKITLKAEEVRGSRVLTNFHGMDMTSDKLRGLVKRWQTMIESYVDAKTTDGHTVRMFAIGFTKKRQNQLKKATYAQASQTKQIRQKMRDIMAAAVVKSTMDELVKTLIPEVLGQEIEKACHGIYPLRDCYIRKLKIVKAPKLDYNRLMDLHSGVDDNEDVGMMLQAKFGENEEEVAAVGADGEVPEAAVVEEAVEA